ncbi:MAG: hypothetical protein FJ083_09150 [Cyanobacteria bacterium K_Offshore_surface_m2_239]|nr:hypothetical protein [Cyanobacteria bacterium K_Offshore_surface_m2_239]
MLTSALVFTIWSASFTIIFGIGAMIARGQATHARSLVRVDRIRRSFADARIKLFGLVTSGKLDPESATFRNLYFLHTSVMRRQDMYDDMWKVFVRAILRIRETTGDRQIELESSEWSYEVREVVIETAQAVQLMILEHFHPLRRLVDLDSWSSNLKVANPNGFSIATTIMTFKQGISGAISRSPHSSIPDSQVKEVEEFHTLILSAAS